MAGKTMIGDCALYLKDSMFETEGRTISLSESRQHGAQIVGKFNELAALVKDWKTGVRAPSVVKRYAGVSNLYILNFNLAKGAGEEGVLTVNLVETDNPKKPYHETVSLQMQAVEWPLAQHPKLQEKETQNQIRLWELTDPNLQWRFTDAGPVPQYMYVNVESSSDTEYVDENGQTQKIDNTESRQSGAGLTEGEYTLKDVDDQWAVRYALAKLRGIETFTNYLPVIERAQRYLEIPDINVDSKTHKVSGTLNPEDLDKIGTFDTPPFHIKGFAAGENGKWFKSDDRINQEASGGWGRNEQWTYTNDMRFTWIYEDGAANKKKIELAGVDANVRKMGDKADTSPLE